VDSCDVNILILTKPHARNPVSRIIYIKSTPFFKDFLFEPFNFIDLSLYAYFIDASLERVLTRNNTFKWVKIFRNLRLGIIIEINYNNCFYVVKKTIKILKIAVRYNTKPGWFKKSIIILIILLVITSTIGLTNYVKFTVITYREVLKLFENFGNFIVIPLSVLYINIKTAPFIIINEILF